MGGHAAEGNHRRGRTCYAARRCQRRIPTSSSISRSRRRAARRRQGAARRAPRRRLAPERPHLGRAARRGRAEPVSFQRRSLDKDTWPGALDVAVTGHLRAGEAILDGLREAREEIGLDLAPGRRGAARPAPARRRARRGRRDRELQEIFATATSLPLASLTARSRRGHARSWRSRSRPRARCSAASATIVEGLRNDGDAAAPSRSIAVRAADFVPVADGYYVRRRRSLARVARTAPPSPRGPSADAATRPRSGPGAPSARRPCTRRPRRTPAGSRAGR